MKEITMIKNICVAAFLCAAFSRALFASDFKPHLSDHQRNDILAERASMSSKIEHNGGILRKLFQDVEELELMINIYGNITNQQDPQYKVLMNSWNRLQITRHYIDQLQLENKRYNEIIDNGYQLTNPITKTSYFYEL